ncbi:MAG: radical SAM protein [Nannocystaceae bacterium]
MDYIGRIFRPPSEANSLLLQVTVGCSHNRCAYCDMYRDKQFRAKPLETILADLRHASRDGTAWRRVFLCDGDALILGTARLLEILAAIREHLPTVRRVGTYGDTRSVGRKPTQELTQLREAGLGIVYHGMESGDDEVLKWIDKGGTRAQCVETAGKLRDAGISHSVIVLLGIGGVRWSEQHAIATGDTLTEMDPPFVGALTTTIVPGTPLHARQQDGSFQLPGQFGLLRELRTIVARGEFSNCRFSSNHASNYLPLQSTLPRDKRAVLQVLDRVLTDRDPAQLKPDWLRGL